MSGTPDDGAGIRILEINIGIAPPKAQNHFMIEVGVCLKTWPHQLVTGARAASSFAYSWGCLRRASSRS